MNDKDFIELEQEEIDPDEPAPEKPKGDRASFLKTNTARVRDKLKGRKRDYSFPRL